MNESKDKNSLELVLRASQLQQEAMQILGKLGLVEILKEISEPKVVGSVKNGLMVVKDIDIHAYVREYDLQKIVNLLPRLALLPTIQKVQLSNFREFRRDYRSDRINFPHAYYIGLRTIQPSGEWKIDIWFARKEDVEEFNDPRLQNLSNEQRETILRLKTAWHNDGAYRDGAVSVDFYKAVLDFGVKTDKDFECYLQSQSHDKLVKK